MYWRSRLFWRDHSLVRALPVFICKVAHPCTRKQQAGEQAVSSEARPRLKATVAEFFVRIAAILRGQRV